MMEAFYIDENGTRQMLEIPDNATNLTESLNSSRTVDVYKRQVCNRRFRILLFQFKRRVLHIS